MSDIKKKLSTFETATLSDLKNGSVSAYIPLFTTDIENNKENVNNFIDPLVADNINIRIDNEVVSAKDTTYTPGTNIEISSDNQITYTGNMPAIYRGKNGIRIENNEVFSDFKARANNFGSKLNPVTFISDYTVAKVGHTIDSIKVVRDDHTTGMKRYVYIGDDSIAVSNNMETQSVSEYYCTKMENNKRVYAWMNSLSDGYEYIKPCDYTHIIINCIDLNTVVIKTSFLSAMNGIEVVLNVVNRETDFIRLNIKDDIGLTNRITIYDTNMGFTYNMSPGDTARVVYYSNAHAETDFNWSPQRQFVYPPFCGNERNANNHTDNKSYEYLSSSIRFIPFFKSTREPLTIVSTLY